MVRPISEWFVVFGDLAAGRSWWDVFTRPGFRHVFAFGFCVEAQAWVLFDVRMYGLEVCVLSRVEVEVILTAAQLQGCRVLKYQWAPLRRRPLRLGRLLGFWCAPAISHLLRLDGTAIRPEGLYRMMRRAGAEVLIEPGTGGR